MLSGVLSYVRGKMPFDKQDIKKKIAYAPTSEEKTKKCDRCFKTDFEYVFDTCGHRLCQKCSLETNVPNVSSQEIERKYTGVGLLDY